MKMIMINNSPRLCLFAIVKITTDTEITYNYGDGFYPWRQKNFGKTSQTNTASVSEYVIQLPVEVENDSDSYDDSYDSSPGSLLGELIDSLDESSDANPKQSVSDTCNSDEDVGIRNTTTSRRTSTGESNNANSEQSVSDTYSSDEEVELRNTATSRSTSIGESNNANSEQSVSDTYSSDEEVELRNTATSRSTSIGEYNNANFEQSVSDTYDSYDDVGLQNKATSRSTSIGPSLSHDQSDSDVALSGLTSVGLFSSHDSSDSSCDEDEPIDILRDKTNPSIFIREVTKSNTTSSGRKKKTNRVHNSYQHCDVCNKKVSNFSQHIRRKNTSDVHNRNEDIKKIVEMQDKREQKRELAILRHKYNHINNLRTLDIGKGELILERRPTSALIKENYGACPHCLAWIVKKALYKHQAHCIAMRKMLSTAEILTQSATLSHEINDTASTGLVQEVFAIMQNDEIGTVARSDMLIIMLGNQWYEKNIGNELKRARYTAEIMRLVARLCISLRNLAGNQTLTLWECLKPEHFNSLVKATLMVAAGDMDDEDQLRHPSNARKLGFDIKRLLNLKIGLSIEKRDQRGKSDAEDVVQLMNVFWGTKVAKLANVILEERRFNKVKSLPLAEDIEALNVHLNKRLTQSNLEDTSAENYQRVSELALVKLMVYNRRRTGEMEGCR